LLDFADILHNNHNANHNQRSPLILRKQNKTSALPTAGVSQTVAFRKGALLAAAALEILDSSPALHSSKGASHMGQLQQCIPLVLAQYNIGVDQKNNQFVRSRQ